MASTTGLSDHCAVLSSSASGGGVNGSIRSPSLNGLDSVASGSGFAAVFADSPVPVALDEEDELFALGRLSVLLAERSFEPQPVAINNKEKTGATDQMARICVIFQLAISERRKSQRWRAALYASNKIENDAKNDFRRTTCGQCVAAVVLANQAMLPGPLGDC